MTATALALAALLALVALGTLRYADARGRVLANLHRPYGRIV